MSETSAQELPDEAMDLLVKQAVEGLSPAEQRVLDVQDSAAASAWRRDLERAAAALVLAGSAPQPPPAALVARLTQQGQQLLAPKVESPAPRPAPPAAGGRSGVYGWFAAAACLLLAVFGWLRPAPPAGLQEAGRAPPTALAPPDAEPKAGATAPAPPAAAPEAPTPAEARAALLAKAGSLKLTWGATKDPLAAGVGGDVVWDPATQQGFMRFVNLPKNDPGQHQYQLWIFDSTRDARYPVDGGVFDVPADATEVVVPIHAAIAVGAAQAFAVTVEKPGGVVVSAREHIVALAQAQAG